MLELVIRFRSQGMQWPLRPGDTVEVRQCGYPDALMTIQADLLIELVMLKVRDLEMLDAMKNGTQLRKPLAVIAAAPNLKEQRRLQRRKRS